MLKLNRIRKNSGIARGFTIVELLIVIIVIAILASITIVAYSGAQDRAKNTTIIDTASSIVKMIQVYAATNTAYPSTVTTGVCVTTGSGCTWSTAYSGNTTFDTNLTTVGNVPRSVPTVVANDLKGIYYFYNATRTMDGKVQPAYLVYHLKGANQPCGVPGVSSTTTMTTTTSTTGYTYNDTWNGVAITDCYVSIPGPTS